MSLSTTHGTCVVNRLTGSCKMSHDIKLFHSILRIDYTTNQPVLQDFIADSIVFAAFFFCRVYCMSVH